MLKPLKNKDEIKNAQTTFENVLESIVNKKIRVKIGYKGGNVEADISYSEKYNFWFYLSDIVEGGSGKKRYWNVFGMGRPNERSNVSITVEINSPLKGIYRKVAGVFAKDDKGNIFLLHRGIIGGGRKGIGKRIFYEYYDGDKVLLQEDKEPIALIGCITDPDFPKKLKKFIEKVNEIKNLVSLQQK